MKNTLVSLVGTKHKIKSEKHGCRCLACKDKYESKNKTNKKQKLLSVLFSKFTGIYLSKLKTLLSWNFNEICFNRGIPVLSKRVGGGVRREMEYSRGYKHDVVVLDTFKVTGHRTHDELLPWSRCCHGHRDERAGHYLC